LTDTPPPRHGIHLALNLPDKFFTAIPEQKNAQKNRKIFVSHSSNVHCVPFVPRVLYVPSVPHVLITIQLPNPNNSALYSIIDLRTALALQPLFIKFPLVANETTKRALIPYFFVQPSKYKGIRAS
jgi:hypothetical protein